MKHLKKALEPALSNVKLNWSNSNVRQAPSILPPVFNGSLLIVYATLPDDSVKQVTLTAEGSNGPLSWSIDINPSTAVNGHLIRRLAAKALIREMEEEERSSGSQKHKKEIVRSLAY
jgi:hypothetical protein